MKNAMIEMLEKIRFTQKENFAPFFPRTRDRDDVGVLQCQKTGVLVLDRTDHQSLANYEDRDDFLYWGSKTRKEAAKSTITDTIARSHRISKYVQGKKWLDVGTGAGGILDEVGKLSESCSAVEPHSASRKALQSDGYHVFSTTNELPVESYDFVTLFHSLEHMLDPLQTLKKIKESMKRGGVLHIEIPHAKDALIEQYQSLAFKQFTFWSEHLILHTHESLKCLLEHIGFEEVRIEGVQRYSVVNHLHWLAKAEPGGQQKWAAMESEELNRSYEQMLQKLKLTDTIVAWAVKNN